MQTPNMKIVLVTPEIPYNTGAIGRTCVALDLELILIHPIGFSLEEKAVRRAGMDYWKHVRLTEYDSWTAFLADRQPERDQLFFFENHKMQTVYDAQFGADAYLIFGCESSGIPQDILNEYRDHIYSLPMTSPHIRSLNLANTATAVIYQAMRPFLGG